MKKFGSKCIIVVVIGAIAAAVMCAIKKMTKR